MRLALASAAFVGAAITLGGCYYYPPDNTAHRPQGSTARLPVTTSKVRRPKANMAPRRGRARADLRHRDRITAHLRRAKAMDRRPGRERSTDRRPATEPMPPARLVGIRPNGARTIPTNAENFRRNRPGPPHRATGPRRAKDRKTVRRQRKVRLPRDKSISPAQAFFSPARKRGEEIVFSPRLPAAASRWRRRCAGRRAPA